MAKRTRKSRNLGLIVLLAAAFIAAAAATFYLAGGFKPRRPKSEVKITRPPVVTLSEQRRVTLYLPKKSKKGVYLAPQTISTEAKGSKLDAALSALLAAGQGKGECAGLIP